jgi:hypothetical protein
MDKPLLNLTNTKHLRKFCKYAEKATVKRAITFFDDFNIEGTQAGLLPCGGILLKSGRLCVKIGKTQYDDEVWLSADEDEQLWKSSDLS